MDWALVMKTKSQRLLVKTFEILVAKGEKEQFRRGNGRCDWGNRKKSICWLLALSRCQVEHQQQMSVLTGKHHAAFQADLAPTTPHEADVRNYTVTAFLEIGKSSLFC